MNCAHCKSQDIRLFKVIHEEGTSVEEIRAEATPKWNTQPFSSHGKQKIKGTRVVQTALAKRCSPPSDPESTAGFIAAFPAMVFAAYLAFKFGGYFNSFWVGLIAFVVICIGSTMGLVFVWSKFLGGHAAVSAYKRDIDQWSRSWLCHKCGGVTVFARRRPHA